MKTLNTFRQILTLVILFAFMGLTKAQLFENTLGDLANMEDVWDGKQLPTGNYALLSTTQSFGNPKIMITELNPTGASVQVFSINDFANQNHGYNARAFELDLSAAGAHTGYFITGHLYDGTNQKLIVIRTDAAGNVTWSRVMNNMVNNQAMNETGMSIERQSNGEIIVVGSTANPATGLHQMIVTRLTAAGGTVWAYRYSSGANTSFSPAESCNGTRNGAAVVAITGKYKSGNTVRTFGSCINAATGQEFWRKIYQSNGAADEGIDIVQNPVNLQFMIVGRSFDNAGNSDLWIVKAVSGNGNFSSGGVHDLGANVPEFVGRDVCLSYNAGRAVVAGYTKELKVGGYVSRAFALEIGFAAGSVPVWFISYEDSSPNPAGSESIEKAAGQVNGYIIGTDAYLTGSAAYDQHAIRIDGNGLTGLADCQQDPKQVGIIQQGASVDMLKARQAAVFLNLVVNRAARDLSEEPCDGVPFGGPVDGRSESEPVTESFASTPAVIFPNPATTGSGATLSFSLENEQQVSVAAFDLSGRRLWNADTTFQAGKHEVNLPAGEWTPGIYFIQLQTATQSQTLKLNVGK